MSTDYITSEKISEAELFGGRLTKYGVREPAFGEQSYDPAKFDARALTDDDSWLWVNVGEYDGNPNSKGRFIGDRVSFRRTANSGAVGAILGAIAEEFGVEIYSEYQSQFWGFDTQEEWDAYEEKIGKENADKYYAKLLKFFAGATLKECDLRRGTLGAIWAQRMKSKVKADPSLLLLENRARFDALLRKAQESTSVRVKLSDVDIASVTMATTPRGNLPRA